MVTASDLVRQFGHWQERALRAPVYVLHRGRPRLVLTSIDVMDALCAPHLTDAHDDATFVLDAVDDLLVLANHDLAITASSRAARAYFGELIRPGASIESIAAESARAFLGEALHRVVSCGLSESFELPSARLPQRTLTITIMPHPGGIAVVAQDITVAQALRDAEAQRNAVDQSIAAIPGVATVRINLRGYIDHPDAALAALTGLTMAALEGVRFVTLMELSARVAVGETIEGVIADGRPRSILATLLINRAAPAPIRLGLAALRRGTTVEAILAIMVADRTILQQA